MPTLPLPMNTNSLKFFQILCLHYHTKKPAYATPNTAHQRMCTSPTHPHASHTIVWLLALEKGALCCPLVFLQYRLGTGMVDIKPNGVHWEVGCI